MTEAKHKERIAALQKAIDEIERPKTTISIELIAAIAIPLVFLISVLVINPSFFQREENGETSRNFKRIILWTLGIAVASFAGFGFWYWYRDGKLITLF